MVDSNLTESAKTLVDGMTHEQLCRFWRFCPSETFPTGDLGEYVKDRLFKHFGGFTPEISKRIGHDNDHC